MISQTIEDYLKAIYKLQKTEGKVFTLAVAERIGVSAASVTVMLKKLAKMNLLKHTPYQGAILTEKGERIALNVIRRHRLSELFLNEFEGLSWDKLDAEVEKLEHVISEELADRIEEVLGYPKTDPHGDPIPTKGGGLEEVFYESLVDSEVGQTVIIRRVSDNSSEILRYIARDAPWDNYPFKKKRAL